MGMGRQSAHPGSDRILDFRSVSKAFGGVQALRGVSLSVRRGEIHAIVGANGAGKSTLIKILAGAVRPDSGQIMMNGEPLTIHSPDDARKAGISTVHQELSLFPDLSVASNLVAGAVPSSRGVVSLRRMVRDAQRVLDRLDLRVDPMRLVGELPLSQQQMIEIGRALFSGGDVLILDEPNSALSANETETLLQTVRTLATDGVTVILVSHRLEEVFAVADQITVLRDGAVEGTDRTRDTSITAVIERMVGEMETSTSRQRLEAETSELSPILELRSVAVRHVGPVDLSVRPGEIVGLVGLEGSGIDTVLRAAGGVVRARGSIVVEGEVLRFRGPADAIAHGVVFLPPERKTEGLWLGDSIERNLAAGKLSAIARGGFIRSNALRRHAGAWLQRVSVHVSYVGMPVGALSGGNQQRVMFARCLSMAPRVLLLSDPTRGVDVRAKAEIHALIKELAQEGHAIAIASSELDEMVELADRLVCMRGGRVVAERASTNVTTNELLELIGTARM